MARLRNTATGVVVEVADGKKLDGYEPVKTETTTAKTQPKKAASK